MITDTIFKTLRQSNIELKETFTNIPQQNYMDDVSNLIDINLKNKKVLVIGDIHAPFLLTGYLEHCISTYKKYKCDTVVFTGDLIDNHYSSYHETDPNGYSGNDELERALDKIKEWNKAFPKAYVLIGNHDRMVMRKANTGSIPRQWIRTYKAVLETPKWTYIESLEIDDVMYVHGEGGSARSKVKTDLQSYVQGHLHSQAYIEFTAGNKQTLFGMQVGCGVDMSSYAMSYAKHFKKVIIACGVVIKGSPYLELM